MDKQIDQHGYWSRLIEADPTINIEDDVDEHLRKVRAIAERIGPNLDWEQSPSVRTITRPDAEGWKIAEELRVIAESIAAREKANRSVG